MSTQTTPLTRVLVANRGEIAVRVVRACHDLGIEAVAVHSAPDADALHVREADGAALLGGPQAKESYLRIDRVVAAALEHGCQAVHPGYGFLAENPELARACAEAGLVFVGPAAEVMEAVGNKVRAREIAEQAAVPVIPGSGNLSSVDEAVAFAERVGYPVMLKAAAGGGGRGIRRADDEPTLRTSFPQAVREAEAAFGDGSVFLEKCVIDPRHVEVQIVADRLGNVVHLGERECSLQRRRQKLVEESPAPRLEPRVRDELCAAAVRLAKQVGYTSAGTVEFLVDPRSGEFYFIEVNARIQVEHGVSELVTGVDIIGEQLRVASGLPLSVTQDDVTFRGAAIELRVNAENPRQNFFPSPGQVTRLRWPGGPGIRVDSGLEEGDRIQPYYDSMIAKVLVTGRTRDEAVARARRALRELSVEGVHTTAELQRSILDWDTFTDGSFHTGSLDGFIASWTAS
ncbi:acetyl-CoA carboxylase biotin carboxylase subunit [Streptomyces sp. HM190]|uniref:acetyl-CoA carboxylase biotin carboxylase subunit n=1 Tax=Streptomyces sp. HM190 TaxID=2695266 RepID=UPI001356AEE5|nr:acetyl-CoA carboxylase biotin carboxylase subunit [Streptomyces sp. HM190]